MCAHVCVCARACLCQCECMCDQAPPSLGVSRCGLAVRRLTDLEGVKQTDLGSIRFGSPFSSLQKLWFIDTVL